MIDYSRIPLDGVNNVWFSHSSNDAVLVFVHGVLSSSRTCWLYENKQSPEENAYWPSLVENDARFRKVGIFLGGYHTSVDSGSYEVHNCADELFAALKRPDRNDRPPPLATPKLTFICHSMGGIVVRSMIERNWADFSSKTIGLVLIASPSYGSTLANSLEWLMDYFNNQQGLHLRWGSWSLEDLDDRFRELKERKRIPNLSGVEFYENHFIVHHKWLPIAAGTTVVSKAAQGRYFGAPIQIPDSDHFSICKPKSTNALIHQYLYDFLKINHLLPSATERRVATEITTRGQGETVSTIELALVVPVVSGSEHEPSALAAPEGLTGSIPLTTSRPVTYDTAAIRMLLTGAVADFCGRPR
jgi:pimeloyl-ACP methyl ester carboxylesterase